MVRTFLLGAGFSVGFIAVIFSAVALIDYFAGEYASVVVFACFFALMSWGAGPMVEMYLKNRETR